MYDTIYNNNFFLNFIPTFIFLSLIISISFSKLKLKIFGIDTNLFEELRPTIIFYSFFGIITFIFNYIIITDNYFIFRELKYFLYFSIIIMFLLSIKYGNNLNIHFKKRYNSKKSVLVYIFLLLFFLISILPLSDVDSIAVHLNSASYIFLNGLSNVNLFKDYEFLSIANTEILLILSPILGSDNFGAALNFCSILLIYLIFSKKNENFFLFLFSCPLILFLISTQKLQIFFGILYLVLFMILKRGLIKNKLDTIIFLFLLSFYASAKINYILFALPLYLFFLIKYKKFLLINIIYSFLIFIIFFIPIYFLKYKYFGNPIAPFFDYLFNEYRSIFHAYSFQLKNTGGWLLNYNDPKIFIEIFLPTSVSALSTSLGLIFFIQIFNLKLLKRTNFFPILLILITFLTGQLLPRYYFESFLILSFYFYDENRLTRIIKYSQSFFVIIFSLTFVFFAYFKYNVLIDKNNFMNKFSYGYFNSNKYSNINTKKNILVFNEGRESIFFDKNIYTSRYIGTLESINEDKINILIDNYIKKNNIKYTIADNIENFKGCYKLSKIQKINQFSSRRNFLVKDSITESFLYELDLSECN